MNKFLTCVRKEFFPGPETEAGLCQFDIKSTISSDKNVSGSYRFDTPNR